tara:strand:+ start:1751 stop:1957 length:207 start_codon:yes stop_codon:yes gene_type:complete
MAERYSILPTEVFDKATTFDLHIFNNSNAIKNREHKKAQGDNITDTYSPEQLEDMYSKFKEKHVSENK